MSGTNICDSRRENLLDHANHRRDRKYVRYVNSGVTPASNTSESPFEIIPGSVNTSFPSCQDGYDEGLFYRPGAFYFRRDIRNSQRTSRVIEIGLVVCHETEMLQAWACGFRVNFSDQVAGAYLGGLAGKIKRAVLLEDAVEAALEACRIFEQTCAEIWAAGWIPPRWRVSPDEADEKGMAEK